MAERSPDALDLTYAALADPTRRAIMLRLRDGEARVTDVARPLPMSLASVSRHITVLERAGLVHREIRGRDHYLLPAIDPLLHADQWLADYTRFWEERADALATLIEREPATSREDSA